MNKFSPSQPEETVALPRPLKLKIKDGLVALSLANLCFIKVGFDLLSDHDRYFDKLPVTTATLLAMLTNLFGFALVFWLIMQVRRRFPNALLHLVIHLLFFLLLLLPADFIRIKFFNIADYQIFKFLQQPMVILSEVVLLALMVWQHRMLAKIAAVCVGILSPLAIFAVIKILLVCLGGSPLQQCTDELAPPAQLSVQPGQPRVIWMIFDETDYRLTLEKPPADYQFPEFQRLMRESLSATAAKAPADMTYMSMPSLILGRRISAADAGDTCDMKVTFAESGETTTWYGQPSVFSEARKLGFNTALVGWYLPYQRELGDVLNFCEWYPYPAFEPTRAKTFSAEVWQQIDSLTETVHLRKLFINIHLASLQAALPVVTNSVYGLTLLHLPAPHKPGIYLPDEDRFSARLFVSKVTGYFNNLVLADRELGKLRRAMEASGQWDETWIIVSADHSWRDSKLYDGVRDYRVPYLIKPPGAPEPATYNHPFNTILTHDLILAILRGELTNRQDTAQWLDAHGKDIAPIALQGKE